MPTQTELYTNQTISLLTERLVKEFDPEKIILFGSHAWGTPTKDSDIDLCVVVKHSTERQLDRMHKARVVTRGISVAKDILVKTEDELLKYLEILPTLESKILRKGRVVYERAG